MKKIVAACLGACGFVLLAFAADTAGTWQPLKAASYKIFAGESVADAEAPTAKNRKLSIVVDGQAAKEIFDSIGPDEPETCSSTKGDRERNKGAVQCMYTASDPGKGYRCWVGVDLVSGKGIATVSC